MSAQPDLLHVQLSQLKLSPLNARKTGAIDVAGLAASIEAHGLLQNLSVTPSANEPDAFDVIAGGRRLAALQLLQSEGRLASNFLVPIRLITDEAALEASTAENTLREAMHPADQFDAFKSMVEAKKSIPDIAAHFGVPEVIVKQRLKLANVAPALVQIYRDGDMELAQLQALALSDNHALQERVWFNSETFNRHAYNIRQALTKTNVSGDTAIAKFVGIDNYIAAGGEVNQDLFSTREQAYLTDPTLLETLAMDKLEEVAQSEREAGWSWVEARISAGLDVLAEYPHSGAQPKVAKPTGEAAVRIAAITARLAEIEQLNDDDQDAHDDDDPRCLDEDTRDALEAESDQLIDERELLSRRNEVWPAKVMETAGVVVYLDQNGLRIARGRLRPGQKVSAAGVVSGTATQPGKPEPAKKATLSADMITRLEMHRAAAIREHVAADPEKALTLLLTHLALCLVTTSHSDAGLDLRPQNAHGDADIAIRAKYACLGKAPARNALSLRVARLKKDGMPTAAVALYDWMGKQTKERRMELLALFTALTVETNPGARGAALAADFGVDMSKWWQPTADGYIGVVQKGLLAEAVGEVAGKAAGDGVLAMKKDAAMAEAAKTLNGTGWLPKPLRGEGYKLGKPVAAKAPPSATAKAPARPAKKAAAPAKEAAKALRPDGNRKKPAKKVAKAAAKKSGKKPAKAGA